MKDKEANRFEKTHDRCCDWMNYAREINAIIITAMQNSPEVKWPMMYLNVKANPPFVIQKIVRHCPDCGKALKGEKSG